MRVFWGHVTIYKLWGSLYIFGTGDSRHLNRMTAAGTGLWIISYPQVVLAVSHDPFKKRWDPAEFWTVVVKQQM